MIPPTQPVRIRSIVSWIRSSAPPEAKLTPAAVSNRAHDLDEQMLTDFENREDQLKARMMQEGTWGTEEGLTSFPTQRLQLWSEVANEYLPTSSQPLEV